ncbi:MAG: LamG domain-containing protein [Candidatus Omnitrophica bacterium]|nr:LamG domain-containing protein [Candidatus Omnitrophota bacterium]
MGAAPAASQAVLPTPTPGVGALGVENANYALEFDGVNDWLDMNDLNIPGDFTIEAWVFLMGGIINASDAIVGQVGLGQDINCHDRRWRYYAGTSLPDIVVAQTLQDFSEWTHIAITRQSGTMKLYINGVLESSGYWTQPFIPKAIARGNDCYGTCGFLEGRMDEIRIWEIARSHEEVYENRLHPVNETEFGLVAYWRFDEGEGQIAHDISGTGNDAPLGQSTLPEQSDPRWVLSDIPGWVNEIPTPGATRTPTASRTPTPTFTPVDQPPSQPSVNILPDLPKTNDDLFCQAGGSVDPEGNDVTLSYAWYRDGVQIEVEGFGPVTGPSLSHVFTAKGQTIECRVTPFDGAVEGPFGSDSVVIRNSPPTAPGVRILPEKPNPNVGLAVLITQESIDPDGDFVTYVFQWFESTDGVSWTLRPEVSGNLIPFVQGQPEISNLYTQGAEFWRVDVIPVDLSKREKALLETNPSALDGKALTVGEIGTARVYILPDLDGNGVVDAGDLLRLLPLWGKSKQELGPDLQQVYFDTTEPGNSAIGPEHLFKLLVKDWREGG